MNPNKVFFQLFLGMAMTKFKQFYKEEQETFTADEKKRIDEAPNEKVRLKLIDNYKKGFDNIKKNHARFLDINGFILKSNVSRMNLSAQEHFHKMEAGAMSIIQEIRDIKDMPNILRLIIAYNHGAFEEFFKTLDEKAAETKNSEPITEESELNVGDWIVTKDGETRQITSDNMPDLPFEKMARFATIKEISAAKSKSEDENYGSYQETATTPN